MNSVREKTDHLSALTRENGRLRQAAEDVFHQFNNQLTIISGYTNLLIEGGGVGGQTLSKLGEIARAADRAKEVARRLVVASESRANENALLARGGHARVLVVDDEPSVRLFMRTVLEQLQYDVTDAATPREALQRVKDGFKPDLVVTDIAMPGMNGRRMVSEMEAIASGFKVLYVSGFVDPATNLDCEAIQFLAKPFSSDALGRKVRELLDA